LSVRRWVVALAALLLPATLIANAAEADDAARIPGFSPKASAVQAAFEAEFQKQPTAELAKQWLHRLADRPGRAGTAGDVERTNELVGILRKAGFRPQVKTYYVYLNQPTRISVKLTKPTAVDLPVKEAGYPWQKDFDEVSPGWNAMGTPGKVTAPVVYANYGREADFQTLADMGVDVKGKIVMVRYGSSARGAKTSVAKRHGAAGVLLYSDDYGTGTAYPAGPYKTPDSIERGSVMYWWNQAGDPLTPGRAATRHAHRIDPAKATNIGRLPTTPVGYGAAQQIMETMKGPEAPASWKANLPVPLHLGDGTTELSLDLRTTYRLTPVHDVVVRIPGKSHPDQRVLIGGHYDAWTYGADDNTGSAVLGLQVANGLSTLLRKGWRPDRTIDLAFWDAEEYGMFGSTEYAEDEGKKLDDVVAYINLERDAGPASFGAAATPSLDKVTVDTAKAVTWPDGTGRSIYDTWSHNVGRLGSGSDYTAYIDHFGVPVTDAGGGTRAGLYHTAYDDVYFMDHYGDPTYEYSAAVARYEGVLTMRLADADVPYYSYSNYATVLKSYLDGLQTYQTQQYGTQVVDLTDAYQAAAAWGASATAVENGLDGALASGTLRDRREVSRLLTSVDRTFIEPSGLPQRPWFRNQVYSTGIEDGYGVEYLPGIRDALQSGDLDQARAQTDILVTALKRGTGILDHAGRLVPSGSG
jgi:N-acetylated-alpha-linked acidic dipeptidase